MKTPSDLFLSLLPASQRDRAKAYLAAAGCTVAAVMPLIPHVPEGVGVFMAVLVGLGVFAQPNGKLTPSQQALAERVAEAAEQAVPVVEAAREVVAAHRATTAPVEAVEAPVFVSTLAAPLEPLPPVEPAVTVVASAVPGKVSLY